MTSLLHTVLLPVSKVTQEGRPPPEDTARRMFGIDDWLGLPKSSKRRRSTQGCDMT